jgi:carbon-monoxide dehydrogenase medium subunit
MTPTYLCPTSTDEAVAILVAWAGRARVIAGGTDLMLAIQQGRARPDCLVDITRIPELGRVDVADGWVCVGAAVTFARLQDDPYLRAYVPALVEAAASVGAAAIQAVATWAGNIAQAMPAADGGVVAMALEAEVCVSGPSGACWHPVDALYGGAKTSTLDPTRQLITQLRFRAPGPGWGCAWRRTGRRPSLVLPTLNCAATVELDSGGSNIRQARLAAGPVAALPFRVRAAEAFLSGRPPAPSLFEEAGRIAQGECHPRTSALRASREYRLAIIPALVCEVLSAAAGRAELSLKG